jgi:hypothetical protein
MKIKYQRLKNLFELYNFNKLPLKQEYNDLVIHTVAKKTLTLMYISKTQITCAVRSLIPTRGMPIRSIDSKKYYYLNGEIS